MRKVLFGTFTLLLVMMTSCGKGQTLKGHEYVDLGLSVKWATCNVGANSPEDFGDYYAWGETETKSSYDEDNCETYRKDIGDITGTDRDVAHVNWGGAWRMPTMDEIQELMDNCDLEWTTQNEVEGLKVTSRKNGNSIFLPAACDWFNVGKGHNFGNYWASTPDWNSKRYASTFFFNRDDCNANTDSRYTGYTVRPVADDADEQAATAEVEETKSVINGHEYVDMGLSVNWATQNIGASSPDDYGNYYAWGETKTKSNYDRANCETYDLDIRDIGGTNRDVAHVEWGDTWRMPTKDEFQELIENCDWEWTTQKGKSGYKVTSKVNGNWIFLPAAGMKIDKEYSYIGSVGNYWSSAHYGRYAPEASFLLFDSDGRRTSSVEQYDGLTVRPVSENAEYKRIAEKINGKEVEVTVGFMRNDDGVTTHGNHGAAHYSGMRFTVDVISDAIRVPEGKVWLFKRYEVEVEGGGYYYIPKLLLQRGGTPDDVNNYYEARELKNEDMFKIDGGKYFRIAILSRGGGNIGDVSQTVKVYFQEKSEENY